MKSKIKIMKSKPEVTDSEIQSFMDFDLLLTKNTIASARRRQFRIIKGIVLGSVVVGVLSLMWYVSWREKPHDKKEISTLEKILVPQAPASKTDSVSSAQPIAETVKKDVAKRKTDKQAATPIENTNTNQPPADTGTPVYAQAEPADGYPALYDYFGRELTYPREALKDSVQGVVSIAFTINTEGKPEKISIDQSLGPLFDKEAIRVIANMPPWKPATYNQKPVRSKLSLPLTFQIKK
jgi:TonB family protein